MPDLAIEASLTSRTQLDVLPIGSPDEAPGSSGDQWNDRNVSIDSDQPGTLPTLVAGRHGQNGAAAGLDPALARLDAEALARIDRGDYDVSSATTEGRSIRSRVVSIISSAVKLPTLAFKAVIAKFGGSPDVGVAARSPVAAQAQAGLATERFAQRLSRADHPDALSAAPARLANYLADNVRDIPNQTAAELGVAVEFANRLDSDLGRVAELVDKSHSKPLSDGERQELTTLAASNKHNIKVAAAWIEGQKQQGGADSGPTGTLLRALGTNFQESLLDLADIAALSDLDETADEPVSRSDRAHAHLQHAEAALSVARNLSVPGLDQGAKLQLVGELQAHRDELAQIRDVANGKIDAPGDELRLAAKELWDAPLTLTKFKDGSDKDIAALRQQWSGGAASTQGGNLPSTHPKVGQARMLREFMQHRLQEAGVAKDQLPDLKSLQSHAFGQVLDQEAWEPIHARVETSLPSSNGERTVAHSHIVPAKAIASHFAEDYAGNGINCANRTQYKHVPNLAQTSVTNDSGQTLFSGLRHGILDSYNISGKHLRSLPEGELKQMIGDLLVKPGVFAGSGLYAEGERDATINDISDRVRGSSKAADDLAKSLRTQASQDMAKEMAVAALVSNPAKFEQALNGETVSLDLTSVSLVTPDGLRHLKSSSDSERTMLTMQQQAFAKLQDGGTVELPVRDAEGNPRTVSAKVNVRQFNFGVNEGAVGSIAGVLPASRLGLGRMTGWNFAMAVNDPGLTKLLGPSSNQGLGGDLAAKVEALQAHAEEVEDMLAAARGVAAEVPVRDTESRAYVGQLESELSTVRKNIRTLSDAGAQIKSLWSTQGYRDGEHDPYKLVSRLALASHLMGEDTLFNCKSGKDRTGQLDAEVKYLAVYADKNDGALPPVGTGMEASRAARSDFTLHTGNLEMQRLNTGLPGYKLNTDTVSGLNDLIQNHMRPVYNGGSKFVSS